MVELSDLPKYVLEATIASEDKNFYHHLGVDPVGIIRAAWANYRNSGVIQGGSTITQQLIKSTLLSPERSVSRKIKEIILAFWAERIYNKEEILKMYLNQIPYGGAAYGIEEAAKTYFNKPAKELTLAEATLLAGLPSSPSTYSPFGPHPELAKNRQIQVIQNMLDQGYIDPITANQIKDAPLLYNNIETSIKSPHFVMFVKDYLIKNYGVRAVERGGLEVKTTLDYRLYEATQKILRDGVIRQKYLNVGNGAVLITNPNTVEILTMIGSVDFFDTKNDGNVNVTLANRSPGSAIKPLNYGLAFEKKLITPETILDDSPITYKFSHSPDYTPNNYDNWFHGSVSAKIALASSYNIPAVKILEKNGVQNFIDFAQKMGISTWTEKNRFGLALTLGGGEVTMTDLATAYVVFSNQGVRVDLTPILSIKDYRGRILDVPKTTPARVISSDTASIVSSILSDDNARSATFGRGSALDIPGFAVKTGTTKEKRDNWTIGYNQSWLVAVWVGNNDNSPMSPYLESGNTGAAAIWNPIFNYLLSHKY